MKNNEKIFAVAPMMDWTDRHCRYFHRVMSARSRLYSEMVVDAALVHGDLRQHLAFSDREHPIAMQLAGNAPDNLARAAEIAAAWGYDEINLNVGCPSDRVQSGTFGACLMRQPKLVGICVEAIRDAVDVPVTVKCRIGVDDQDSEQALDNLAAAVFENGCEALWVHARMAWLNGLSPKENRDIPPLDYQRVYRLKQKYPEEFIGINGGIADLQQVKAHFREVDGVMLGRAAYHTPGLLRYVDQEIFGCRKEPVSLAMLCHEMMQYTAGHIGDGGRVNHVTRHMLGLFHGLPGARKYRRIMTVESCKPDATELVIEQAFAAILDRKMVLPAVST